MNEITPFITWLKNRIATQTLPGESAHRRMMHTNRELPQTFPEDSKQSAVLLLLYPNNAALNIVLIKRTENGGVHSGQIAFPGGKSEQTDASLWETALRESREEVNLRDHVTPIGALSPLYIPVSKFVLHPFLGYLPAKPALLASDTEVAAIIEPTLHTLFANKSEKKIAVNSNMYVHSKIYKLPEEQFIWGATAMVLSELEVLFSEFSLLKPEP